MHKSFRTGLLLSLLPAGHVAAADLVNAVEKQYAPEILLVPSKQAFANKTTPADLLFDGDAHTRCVVTGVPYTFVITLRDELPVEKLSISASDYAGDSSPKDITVVLDDGSRFDLVMDRRMAAKRKPAWQEFELKGRTRTLKITVNSLHPGQVEYGGIADIAVWTSGKLQDASAGLAYDANAPVYVHLAKTAPAEAASQVRQPPRHSDGVFPRTILTPDEIKTLRETLPQTEKGVAALKALVNAADAACESELKFPEPDGPLSQVSRSGDRVSAVHDRLSLGCGNLGRAYAFTGEVKYAQRAREILLGYAERYADYPDHKGVNPNDTGKVMSQRLSEAMWLIPLVMSYDMIHESGVLSAEDRQEIETQLIRPCIEYIWRSSPSEIAQKLDTLGFDWRNGSDTRPNRRRSASNWLIFYNSATMLSGAVLQDKDYMDVAAYNLRNLIQDGITDDGLWAEGAIGYQFFAMHGMLPGLETAARHGIDLWSFGGGRAKRLFDSPRQYAYPDGSMPGINDSARVWSGNWQQMSYDYAYARYGDARYASLINNTPRQVHISSAVYVPTLYHAPLPEPPQLVYNSTVYASLGFAILRDEERYALLKYGDHGGVHGHFDKLNLVLYGNADEVGGEPGFYKYDDNRHPEWTVQTLAHNTMTVDGKRQAATKGKLTLFEAQSPVKVMRAECADAYPGAVLDRTVLVTPMGVIDLFAGTSSSERQWDRTLRFRGALKSEAQGGQAQDASGPLGSENGYQHVTLSQKIAADGGWNGTWEAKPGGVTVNLAGAAGQSLFVGKDVDGADLAIARQTGRNAMVGVYYSFDRSASPQSRTTWHEAVGVGMFEATHPDGAVETVFISSRPGEWKAEGYETDARVLYVSSKSGVTQSVLVGGGSFLKTPTFKADMSVLGNTYLQREGGELACTMQWVPEPTAQQD